MNKIKELKEEKGVTSYRMASDLGLPYSTVSDWLHGRCKPKPDNLLLLAKYFRVPVQTLIEAQGEG